MVREQRIWRTPSHVDVKRLDDGKYYVWELGAIVKLNGPEGEHDYTLIDFYADLSHDIYGVFRIGREIDKTREPLDGDIDVRLSTLDPPPPTTLAKAVYDVCLSLLSVGLDLIPLCFKRSTSLSRKTTSHVSPRIPRGPTICNLLSPCSNSPQAALPSGHRAWRRCP